MVEGWVQPIGKTQPCVAVISLCMFIYSNPLGFFLYLEEIAEMTG
jgi:hypothetical protein